MLISPRILRAYADDLPGARPHLSAREQEREDKILAAGEALMVRFGRHALTLSSFALAIRLSPATIRRHFVDLDDLLGKIILRHLLAISRAMGQVPADVKDPKKARRAAYLAFTRTALNAPTPAHLLLLRERHTLPADLAEAVEQTRAVIGECLAGANGSVALALLDTPGLQLPQIEAMLATLAPAIGATLPILAPAATPKSLLARTVEGRSANRILRSRRQGANARAGPKEKTEVIF